MSLPNSPNNPNLGIKIDFVDFLYNKGYFSSWKSAYVYTGLILTFRSNNPDTPLNEDIASQFKDMAELHCGEKQKDVNNNVITTVNHSFSPFIN